MIIGVGELVVFGMATRTAARTLRWLLEFEVFYVFGANLRPIFVVVSHLDVPVNRRILPIGGPHAISMLCWIVMDVIEMIPKIPRVPNTMLPKPSLPYASIPVFTLRLGYWQLVPTSFKPRLCESILKPFEPRRKIFIA